MAEQSSKVPSRAVSSAKSFVAEHGTPARAVVAPIGRAGARVVLVGGDGAMGDIVVPDVATGEAVCAAAGVKTGEWDRETTAATRIGARHRQRMAKPRV